MDYRYDMYDYDYSSDFEVQDSSSFYTVEDCRKDLVRVKEYFQSLPIHKDAMEAFWINYRKMPRNVIDIADSFYVNEELKVEDLPEWITQSSFGIVRGQHILMAGRCVIPVKTSTNDIAGFLGWDPYVKPKYLDSYTYGYKAKKTMLFGMQDIEKYYNSKEPVFLTEGSMCTLWLKAHGFQALSSLGSSLSSYNVTILKRFGMRLYAIPDNDEAGYNFAKSIKYNLPLARICMVLDGKDVDGCRKEHEEELLEDLHNINNLLYKPKILIRR